MTTISENIAIKNGVLIHVPEDYIQKNEGYFKTPDTVTIIGEFALYGSKSLKKITISNTVKTISDLALYGCGNLKQITISDSVETIGHYALSNHHKDLVITIKASEPSEKKAQQLKDKLQKDYPNITIQIEQPFGHAVKREDFILFSQQETHQNDNPSSPSTTPNP